MRTGFQDVSTYFILTFWTCSLTYCLYLCYQEYIQNIRFKKAQVASQILRYNTVFWLRNLITISHKHPLFIPDYNFTTDKYFNDRKKKLYTISQQKVNTSFVHSTNHIRWWLIILKEKNLQVWQIWVSSVCALSTLVIRSSLYISEVSLNSLKLSAVCESV